MRPPALSLWIFSMKSLSTVLMYAVRELLHDLANGASAILCLALGMGVNATMLRVTDLLFLQGPPLVESSSFIRRVYFSEAIPGGYGQYIGSSTSYPVYSALAANTRSFSSLEASYTTRIYIGHGPNAV